MIEAYENKEFNEDIVIIKGSIPILISTPHVLEIEREDGVKLSEPYTKAINLYLNDTKKTYSIINNNKLLDPNKEQYDEYKTNLKRLVNDYDIKIVLDIHGAKLSRDFDIELGTKDNLSVDNTVLNTLVDTFKENGINNISFNDPFKGGMITNSLLSLDVDVIQIEINRRFRNSEDVLIIIKALEDFIDKYMEVYKRI